MKDIYSAEVVAPTIESAFASARIKTASAREANVLGFRPKLLVPERGPKLLPAAARPLPHAHWP